MTHNVQFEELIDEMVHFSPVSVYEVNISCTVSFDTLTPNKKLLEKQGLAFRESMKVV